MREFELAGLVLALMMPGVEVVGVSAVHGNVVRIFMYCPPLDSNTKSSWMPSPSPFLCTGEK